MGILRALHCNNISNVAAANDSKPSKEKERKRKESHSKLVTKSSFRGKNLNKRKENKIENEIVS